MLAKYPLSPPSFSLVGRFGTPSVHHPYSPSWLCRASVFANLVFALSRLQTRIFFICIYLHIGRGLYYRAFTNLSVWVTGVTMLFLLMATAFLGYVLPWGQMSFWGATVITNLFSAIPYLGEDIVFWLWGGFAVSQPTLSRFFALHFFLPFGIAALTAVHLLFLHQQGSRNPLGLRRNFDKLLFHPYFSWKDLIGFSIFLAIFIFFFEAVVQVVLVGCLTKRLLQCQPLLVWRVRA